MSVITVRAYRTQIFTPNETYRLFYHNSTLDLLNDMKAGEQGFMAKGPFFLKRDGAIVLEVADPAHEFNKEIS